MAGMRMSMRKIREVLRLTHELGLSVRQVREATGVGKTAVSEYVSRARVIGITDPSRDHRRRAGAAAVHAGGISRGLDEAAARLDEGTSRAQAVRRDADDPVGGASRRVCRRPWIFPLLRALQRMEKAAGVDDAADARGGRLFVDWAGDTVPIIDPMT